MDIVAEVSDPHRERLWAVVEAKVRLSYQDVEAWAQRMLSEGFRRRLAAAGVPGPYLVYAFSIRPDPGAYRAVERFDIGLLTSEGEEAAPALVS
ncbi:MAG: hypothetical protein HYU88_06460, partial [Chloroflexi bacterium]|nr:hypothetical protein [Chloroflexota bacterium]